MHSRVIVPPVEFANRDSERHGVFGVNVFKNQQQKGERKMNMITAGWCCDAIAGSGIKQSDPGANNLKPVGAL